MHKRGQHGQLRIGQSVPDPVEDQKIIHQKGDGNTVQHDKTPEVALAGFPVFATEFRGKADEAIGIYYL